MSENSIKTKRIDNWCPYLEVEPKIIRRKSGIDVVQMTEPYSGEIAKVLSVGGPVEGKLVMYDKHLKKKVRIDGEDRWFIAEEYVLCEVELEDGMEAVDYAKKNLFDGLSKQTDEKRFEDRRLKNYIEV